MRCVAPWQSLVMCLALVTVSGVWHTACADADSLLAPSARIRVRTANNEWAEGRFGGSTSDSLRLVSEFDRSRSSLSIAAIDGLKQYQGTKRHGVRGVLAGALLLGGAMGISLALDPIDDGWFGSPGWGDEAGFVIMAAGLGGLLGGLVGSLIGTDQWADLPRPWTDLPQPAVGTDAAHAALEPSLAQQARAKWQIGADVSWVLPSFIDNDGWGVGVFARRRAGDGGFLLEPRLDVWQAEGDREYGTFVEMRSIAVRLRCLYFLPISSPRFLFVGVGTGVHRIDTDTQVGQFGAVTAAEETGPGFDAGLGIRGILPAHLNFHLEGWFTGADETASHWAFSTGIAYRFGTD